MAMASETRTARQLLWHGNGWSPKMTHEFCTTKRDWKSVQEFYHRLAMGKVNLEDVGLKPAEAILLGESWKQDLQDFSHATENHKEKDAAFVHERKTFKVYLSYDGADFDGWAFNKDLHSIERVLFEALQMRLGCERLMLSCAGRTDKGVSSCGQVLSFHTWLPVSPQEVMKVLNAACPESIRVWKVERVDRSFHATFSAKWRRYIYLFPLIPQQQSAMTEADPEQEGGGKERSQKFDVNAERVQSLLTPLIGHKLDYYAFARDTPPGKNCNCTVLKCHVSVITIDSRTESLASSAQHRIPCLCMEIVADRFLRRMVRVLMATAIRESIPHGGRYGGSDSQALVKLVQARERLFTAPPASVEGLCLAGVGYNDIVI